MRSEGELKLKRFNQGCVILVIGLPGSGKTHYVEQNLENSVVFDLDHIAAALRLTEPHSERHEAARLLTNDLIFDFVAKARRYSRKTYIIRTAPQPSEVEQISPDKIIVCRGSHNILKRPDYTPVNRCEYLAKIQRVIDLSKSKNIPLEEIKT